MSAFDPHLSSMRAETPLGSQPVPADPKAAIEIPPALKEHLGLDAQRSWIVLGETNEFLWPGPDLRPVSRNRPDECAYGSLPPKFFLRLRERLLELARERRLRRVARDD